VSRMCGMDREEHRSRTRSALARGDGRSLVGLLNQGAWPENALQAIGDHLLTALAARANGAAELALRCIDALDDRGWEGDAELVDQLSGALGRGPTPLLRPSPVDLEDLAGLLEGDPSYGGGRINLQTGQVWPQFGIDDAPECGEDDPDEGDDPGRWLWVNSEGSRPGYRDMELFIDGLDDADAADRLSIAINGRGAFRRFKDVLTRWPDLFDRWSDFSEDRRRAGPGLGWPRPATQRAANDAIASPERDPYTTGSVVTRRAMASTCSTFNAGAVPRWIQARHRYCACPDPPSLEPGPLGCPTQSTPHPPTSWRTY